MLIRLCTIVVAYCSLVAPQHSLVLRTLAVVPWFLAWPIGLQQPFVP